MELFLDVYRKYAQFSGRARRREYWIWALIYILLFFVLVRVEQALGLTYVLSGIFFAFSFIPGMAVGVRRLHDIGRSGWWLLLTLVPLVGNLILLIFAIMDSETGSNRYGPNPKLDEITDGKTSAAGLS